MIVGIIPAAGRGYRWGGFDKWLLPCGQGEWLIDRIAAIMRKGQAERIVVVVNADTAGPIMRHLKGSDVVYVMQTDDRDLYGAVRSAFPLMDEWNLFAMPDTYIPENSFRPVEQRIHFAVGAFETERPERFGILSDGGVIDKPGDMMPPQKAWGILSWSGAVVDHWRQCDAVIESFAHALNLAIGKHNTSVYNLEYYYDMATYADYCEFLKARCYNA